MVNNIAAHSNLDIARETQKVKDNANSGLPQAVAPTGGQTGARGPAALVSISASGRNALEANVAPAATGGPAAPDANKTVNVQTPAPHAGTPAITVQVQTPAAEPTSPKKAPEQVAQNFQKSI